MNLLPHHYAMLHEGSAITDAMITARGYQSLPQPEDLIDRGFAKAQAKTAPALGIPLWDVHGHRRGWQMRPDAPRQMKDGKVFKYEMPKGDHLILDMHPSVQPRIGDPATPLWITEGIRKGDALASQGLCTIALVGGVCGFRGTNEHGGKVILPDWDYVALNGREVLVVFDSDIYLKPAVQKTLKAVYHLLREKHARPRLVRWPEEYRQEKIGIDDFLAQGHSMDEVLAMVPPMGPLPQTPPPVTRNGVYAPYAGATHGGEPPLPLSDYTNALAFVRDHQQDVRYCEAWKKWLLWTGTHWSYRAQGPIYQKAKHTIRQLLRAAATLPDDECAAWMVHIKRSLSTAAIEAMVRSAQNEPEMPIEHTALDRHATRLSCTNVTLDLVTGETSPHARADFLTECLSVPYQPKATCPRWKAFLWQIFGGTDPEAPTTGLDEAHLAARQAADARAQSLVEFLQRLCGLCLTGDVSEQNLYVFYGTGANGKSTLLGVLLALLDNYGMKAAPELLMASRDHDRHPTERADLFGKRLVAAIETEQGRRLNETLVKELTGGDTIRARRMREDFWEFRPTHKIILATNHKPQIRGTDHAIWRRVKLVPFTVTIPDDKQDPTLPAQLLKELPGILTWCVEGCLDWQEHGLRIPAAVLDATETYRQEQDVFEEFLATECFRHPTAVCTSGDLYAAYEGWCKRNDIDALSKRAFGMRLGECDGLTPSMGNGGRRLWRGIGLPTPQPSEQACDTE